MPTRLSLARRAILWTVIGLLGIAVPIIVLAQDASSSSSASGCPKGEKFCPGANSCISETDLCILEPLPGGPPTIPADQTAGMGAFFLYVNNGLWPWAFGVGVGIAVLNCVVGGLQIVLSNGDTGKVDAGKTRFMWATLGLLMLFLAGTILSFINPQGFVS